MNDRGHIEWEPSDVSDWADREAKYVSSRQERRAMREHQKRLVEEEGLELMTPEVDTGYGALASPAHYDAGIATDDLDRGLDAAFDSLSEAYAVKGGHLYDGFTTVADRKFFKGPLIWSEGDCAFRFALALEAVLPENVHLEFGIGKVHVLGWKGRGQFIDIVVSNFDRFETERHEFAQCHHGLFVEVKYIPKRLTKPHVRDSFRAVNAILRDAERLQRHLDNGLCSTAAVLVVDDGDFFERGVFENEFKGDPKYSPTVYPPAFTFEENWPLDVRLLLVSGRQAARRIHARKVGMEMPTSCPSCDSPRVAVVADEGSDPTWGCMDCGYMASSPGTDPPPPQSADRTRGNREDTSSSTST